MTNICTEHIDQGSVSERLRMIEKLKLTDSHIEEFCNSENPCSTCSTKSILTSKTEFLYRGGGVPLTLPDFHYQTAARASKQIKKNLIIL